MSGVETTSRQPANTEQWRDEAAVLVESGPIELSIVMPCLNEARTIPTCIGKALGYLAQSGVHGEIVIGDNGSSDGSQDLARALGARVVDVAERGYGAALQGAIAAARGTYVIMGDADDSYDFASLDGFVRQLRAGHDLVMGNRFAGGIARGAMPPLHKYLGNPVLSGIGRLFFRSPCRDFHCGLRGFRRDAIAGLNLRTTGMEFASEMVVRATIAGLSIAEVPTTLSKDGRDRPPHLRSFRDGWRHLRFLLLFSPRWLYLLPGVSLLLLSVAIGAALLPGPLAIEPLVLDVHSLVVAQAGITIGLQLILMFLLAKRYAAHVGMVPMGERFEAIRNLVTLERAAWLGAILFGLGALGLGESTAQWAAIGFGDLDYQSTMRTVVPSVGAMTWGLQVLFGGFLWSLLDRPC